MEKFKMMGYSEKMNKMKEENDFKEMDENYSYLVDQAKPDFLHRGDVHQATRWEIFSIMECKNCLGILVVKL